MFDIGISEIGVIAVVALVVIGPERLPKVARTIGTLLGRAQRYVNDVKAEVNREMELEELRKLQTQMQDAARGIHEQVSTAGAEMQAAVHDAEKTIHESVSPATAAVEPVDAAAQHLGAVPVEPAQVAAPAATDPAAPDQPASAHMEQAAELTEPSPGETPAAALTPPEAPPLQSSLFPEHTVR